MRIETILTQHFGHVLRFSHQEACRFEVKALVLGRNQGCGQHLSITHLTLAMFIMISTLHKVVIKA